jgi:hypothetical protein
VNLRGTLAPLFLLTLWSCEARSLDPAVGTALAIQIGASGSMAADAGVVHIEGPSSMSLAIEPGETRTVEGLLPGSYSVALEALVGDQLESFGETTVTVIAGEISEAAITLQSFTPSFLDVDDEAVPGVPFPVAYGTVEGAEGYVVQWDDHPSFSSPQSVQVGGTSTNITFSNTGTYVVRVRARGRYGRDGIPTTAQVVSVVNEPPIAVISQPSDGATFTADEVITFEGSANDPEDGPLTGSALVWTSDLDGQIGTGTSFVTSDLQPGLHRITLTATDSGNATGTDSRSIRVQVGAPTVRIGEVSTSLASVGDQVFLPVILDLSGTGGAYEIAELDFEVSFSNVLLGDQSWYVGSGEFDPLAPLEEEDVDATQIVYITVARESNFGASESAAILALDASAVGTARIEVEVTRAEDPGGGPVDPELFSEVPHDLVIEEGNPTIQVVQPGESVAGLEGGVLYFRVPLVSPAPAASGVPVAPPPVVVPSGDARASADRLRDPIVRAAPAASFQAEGHTLRIQISGGVPEADLYVRYGELPTPNARLCRPFIDGNDERCDHVDAPAGDWFVMIRPFGLNGFSNVLLETFLFDAVSIVTTALPGGVVGTPYEVALQAEDGDGTYLWSLDPEAEDLPPGLELEETGTIAGTPTAAGDYTFTVQVVSAGKAAQVDLTISVASAASLE